jgi:hypothetical protein
MLMQRVAHWQPAPRHRAGPAITPTVSDPMVRADHLLAGALAVAVLSGLLLSRRAHAEPATPRLSRSAVLAAGAGFAAGLLLADRLRR